MYNRTSFPGLPAELLLMVIEHSKMQDLIALSGVSKKYNSVCRPIIFRHVDLSIHNRGEILCEFPTPLQHLFCKWNESSDSLQCNDVPPNMQKRYVTLSYTNHEQIAPRTTKKIE